MPRLLYIGCLGYQNMGDEACWEGCKQLFDPILPPNWEIEALNGYDFEAGEPFDAILLGGGTLLSPHGNLGDAALQEARARQRPYFVFGTGLESIEWDSLPPETQLREFVDMVSGASLIGVRGPLSKRYLVSIGVPADRVHIVGDPAVVLHRETRSDLSLETGSGPWLGVNVGTSVGRVYGWDENRMRDELVEALARMVSQSWSLCLFPVWPRDLEVQRYISQSLSSFSGVKTIDFVPNSREIIGMLGEFDAVIAMKLHAGIFSAVAGTPYLPWAYRPKVEDFAAALGVEDFVVRTDADSNALVTALHGLHKNDAIIRSKLAKGIAQMRERLASFARQIVEELEG